VKIDSVEIPVGDFNVSHLSEHDPDLHVHGVPRVHFSQTDGQDLYVFKSLTSTLHLLGFQDEASHIEA
jgi:hypothetical protein